MKARWMLRALEILAIPENGSRASVLDVLFDGRFLAFHFPYAGVEALWSPVRGRHQASAGLSNGADDGLLLLT